MRVKNVVFLYYIWKFYFSESQRNQRDGSINWVQDPKTQEIEKLKREKQKLADALAQQRQIVDNLKKNHKTEGNQYHCIDQLYVYIIHKLEGSSDHIASMCSCESLRTS